MAENTPVNPAPPGEIAGVGLIAIVAKATAAVRALGAELQATTTKAGETVKAAQAAKDAASEMTGGKQAGGNTMGSAPGEPGKASETSQTLSSITAGLLQQVGRR